MLTDDLVTKSQPCIPICFTIFDKTLPFPTCFSTSNKKACPWGRRHIQRAQGRL